MGAIFTIGYEGVTVEDFVAALAQAGIKHVLDIRELPQSRRPGFSKNSLSSVLSRSGISYSHSKSLGDPKEGRDAARQGNMPLFREIFGEHLNQPHARMALAEAAELVQLQRTVLLCYERDPKNCHRSIVAQRLAGLCSLNVRHLGVPQHAARNHDRLATAA